MSNGYCLCGAFKDAEHSFTPSCLEPELQKLWHKLNLSLIQRAKENILKLYTNPYQFLIDHDVPEHEIEQRAGEGWTLEEQLIDYLEERDNAELLELSS